MSPIPRMYGESVWVHKPISCFRVSFSVNNLYNRQNELDTIPPAPTPRTWHTNTKLLYVKQDVHNELQQSLDQYQLKLILITVVSLYHSCWFLLDFYPKVTMLRLGICCRKSVCLSSVTFVHHTQPVEICSNVSMAMFLCHFVP